MSHPARLSLPLREDIEYTRVSRGDAPTTARATATVKGSDSEDGHYIRGTPNSAWRCDARQQCAATPSRSALPLRSTKTKVP